MGTWYFLRFLKHDEWDRGGVVQFIDMRLGAAAPIMTILKDAIPVGQRLAWPTIWGDTDLNSAHGAGDEGGESHNILGFLCA
jgi:hypothetical protein